MNTNYLAQLTAEPSLSSILQNSGVTIGESVLLALVDVWLDKVSQACISIDNPLVKSANMSIIITVVSPGSLRL